MNLLNHFDAVIVGGGFSGMMVTANLINHNKRDPNLRVGIINRSRSFGSGIAYGTAASYHHLNVVAEKMSAFGSHPDHFVNWLLELDQFKNLEKDLVAKTFLSRTLYGQYLESIWSSLEKQPEVFPIIDEAENINLLDDTYRITLKSGKELYSKSVVIATGNEVPGNVTLKDSSIYLSNRYFQNPWDPLCYTGIKSGKDVLIIGNGLTMVDTVLGLINNGVTGTIYSLSPNGLAILSHRHAGTSYQDFSRNLIAPYDLGSLFHDFISHTKKLRKLGLTAEPVIDSIRPHTQKIWHSFSEKEKKMFLSHLRHYWGSARHRLPAHIHDQIANYQITQKLLVIKGRLLSAKENPDGITAILHNRRTKTDREIKVDRIINCTGPESDMSKSHNILIQNLFKQGLIAKNVVGLGLCATPQGEIIDSKNRLMPGLYAIGNLMKGVLWECTAVPELRVSANVIAEQITARIKSLN